MIDKVTALGDLGTRKYLGHFAGHTGEWSRSPAAEDAPEGTKSVLGFFAAGTRSEKPTAECPVEVGQEIRFKPAAYFNGTSGLVTELDVIVTATVIQIHAEHRWYRAEWRTPGGRILRESFKF